MCSTCLATISIQTLCQGKILAADVIVVLYRKKRMNAISFIIREIQDERRESLLKKFLKISVFIKKFLYFYKNFCCKIFLMYIKVIILDEITLCQRVFSKKGGD